jgi:hypothetical protein
MTTPSPTAVTNRQPGIRARLWLRGDWIPGCDWGRRDPAVARLWLHLDDGRLLAFRLPAARFEDDRILERLATESRVSLVKPSGGSCGQTDSLLGDDLLWPRFAPLRAALRHDMRPRGAVGLRTALRRIMGWSAPLLQRALSGHNERCV